MLSLIAAASSTSADSTASQVSTILNAIAPLLWVAVVVLAIVIFRKPLAAAMGRVSEVDVGSAKVVLENQANIAANTVKQVASNAGKPIAEADPDTKQAITQARNSAASNPSGSVLSAWSMVEDAAGAAGPVGGAMSPAVPDVVNELAKDHHLDLSLVPVAKMLASLREVATKSPKAISPQTATSFVNAAGDLANLISQAGAPDGTVPSTTDSSSGPTGEQTESSASGN
jgi:hypothetical protein